jgi:hypothetical protein
MVVKYLFWLVLVLDQKFQFDVKPKCRISYRSSVAVAIVFRGHRQACCMRCKVAAAVCRAAARAGRKQGKYRVKNGQLPSSRL